MEQNEYARYKALLKALVKKRAEKSGKRFKITDSQGNYIIFDYPKKRNISINNRMISILNQLKEKSGLKLDFINKLQITEIPKQKKKKFEKKLPSKKPTKSEQKYYVVKKKTLKIMKTGVHEVNDKHN